MNVSCPSCATVYRVDPAKIPPAGVRARCQICAAVFPVRRAAENEEAPRPVAMSVPAAPLA
ncbi:MAG: zinc-ribbon domain-containing protein, partial [Gemmatimonadales bacterium]